MYLQALQCVSVFLFPGGALAIHQARALTGFTVYLRAFMKFTLEFKVRVLLNMNYTERAFQRTVVLLEKRRIAVPVNTEISRFVNARRVMDIAFTKNHTASPIGDLLCSTFPSLARKDLSGCVVALLLLSQV